MVLTLLFGCEAWFIKPKDVEMMCAFQRYAARRLQRLRFRSLNVTSLMCLGWMNIIPMIKARRIIFIRTIMVMAEYMPIRVILCERITEYDTNNVNQHESVIIQILKYCEEFNLLETVRRMAQGGGGGGGGVVSREGWKRSVWRKAWDIEQEQWDEAIADNYNQIVTHKVSYSIWWMLADKMQQYMRRCELMVKLLPHASLLRGDDKWFKSATFGSRCCILCEHAANEETRHMVMQCSGHDQRRQMMFNEISHIRQGVDRMVDFGILMGGYIEEWSFEEMTPIWLISCTYISQMYYVVLNSRKN